MANRPGILALLAAAERGEFDLVLAEDEDRLARSQVDLPYIKAVLEFLEIPIATLEVTGSTPCGWR
jgi:DNA invertase Pin-like site-specific DNA recombinase